MILQCNYTNFLAYFICLSFYFSFCTVVTLSGETSSSNVFKRLSLRIMNRFSVYSSQGGDTLSRQNGGTLSRHSFSRRSKNQPPLPAYSSPSSSTASSPPVSQVQPKESVPVPTLVITSREDGRYYVNVTPTSTTSMQEQTNNEVIREVDNSTLYKDQAELDKMANKPYSQLQVLQ